MVVTAIVAYLLGSVNTAIIVSKVLYHDDVRKHGSGNAGLTNTLRIYGKNAALLTLAGDVFKTVLAIVIGGLLLGFGYYKGLALLEAPYLAGLFAVLGHIFPVFYHGKGGKGVLVTATMGLCVSPLAFLLLFCVFAAVLAASKYVSLSSVTVAVLYPVVLHAYIGLLGGKPLGLVSLSTILIAILIVVRHMGNLKRIGERTENKFSFKKKEKHEDEE